MVKFVTIKKCTPSLRLWTAYKLLKLLRFKPIHIITMLLSEKGVTRANIARAATVSGPYVSMVLSGKRESDKVVNFITKALGFNPWGK